MAKHFVLKFAHRFGKPVNAISNSSLEILQRYRWPGNVQELRNLLERLVIAAPGTTLDVSPSVLEEGIPLDRYRLVEQLGSGGMGEVWLAKHQLLARPVAVKLIRSDRIASPTRRHELIQRFQREAQATAALNSPNTIQLYDFGVSDGGSFYLVMELLHGLDLDSLVNRYGPVEPQRAVILLRQICRSLSEAHANGLVHRDIKPANIFSCKMGQEYDHVKVLDFGIVKELEGESDKRLTVAGGSLGTPAFMAPEVFGESAVDNRSDLFGVGCVGYWLLTGEPPFRTQEEMRRFVDEESRTVERPSELANRDVPRELKEIIVACLSRSPSGRPASADAIWRKLGDIKFDKPWTPELAESWWRDKLPSIDGNAALGPARTGRATVSNEATRSD